MKILFFALGWFFLSAFSSGAENFLFENVPNNQNVLWHNVRPIWDNEEAMNEYGVVLSSIKQTLLECAQKANVESPFKEYPHPIRNFNRSPQYIFLQVTLDGQEERLLEFYTPFGLVLGAPLHEKFENLHKYSRCFFESMKDRWILEDVTHCVESYLYGYNVPGYMLAPKNFKEFKQEDLLNSVYFKLYVIRKFDNTVFFSGKIEQENMIFFRRCFFLDAKL